MKDDRQLISIIKTAYSSLRSSEQRVADFILGNSDDVPTLNITELAIKSVTSEATVSRFCRAIGLSNYRELRLLLMSNLASERIATIPENINENDNTRIIADKLLYVFSETLRDTHRVLDEMRIDRAVDSIVKSKKVYFYGVGGSGAIARIAHHLFLKAGIVNTVYDDGYMQAVSAALLRRGDLAFGISHSGNTKDVVSALELAKKNGATTIALTGNKASAITQVADIKLVTIFNEEPIYGDFMEAKVGQLYIINILYISLILRNLPSSLDPIEKTAAAIWDRSYQFKTEK
jgi:RpiR family carbohydrate utilization transcriptional regulator